MKILIACEESQRVCIAMREKGHEAYSCDILECSGGRPEWHICGDVLPLLNGYCEFTTENGEYHRIVREWDLIIAFPPCTYLSCAGACRLYKNGDIDKERYKKGVAAREFFMTIFNANCKKICIENPKPLRIYNLPPFNHTIQPYEHGHPFSKRTHLWLKGLPPLLPTNIVAGNITSWVSGGSKDKHGNPRKNKGTNIRSSKQRSKTFEGIAKAIAEQYG